MTSPVTKTNQPPMHGVGNASRKSDKIVLRETQKGSSPKKANTPRSSCIRERGYVEKLMASYGFIQASDRDARFFFHFSQYNSNVTTMKVGDIVEFEESSDPRSGKPLAVRVVRLDEPGKEPTELAAALHHNQVQAGAAVPSSSRIPGTIAKEAKDLTNSGSVSYEANGEYFFLPFSKTDVESSVKAGDSVTFLFGATPSGVACACNIRPSSERFQGVVSSMKDSFGFIERADVVREIFFHFSEYEPQDDESDNLQLGDDVEFGIQTRSGKEVAVQLKKLKRGSVIFEDIGTEVRRGKIDRLLKPLHGKFSTDPLGGRIVYETVSGPIEIPYGDGDQKFDHTLLVGDLVQFNIASDRRDKLQRATNIVLLEDTFQVNAEKREKGEIVTLKDGYGFIRCWDRDARIFFHFSEFVTNTSIPRLNDVLEFAVVTDPNAPSKPLAIRAKRLAEGEYVRPQIAANGASKSNDGTPNDGNAHRTEMADGVGTRTGDKSSTQRGFVAALKDKFGFIETADHQREIFFHFSHMQGNVSELKLGDEVEFSLSKRTPCVSADNVVKLPKGTIETEEVLATLYTGKVLQGLRVNNPDQDRYAGIIVIRGLEDDPSATRYQFGITSLVDPRDPIQPGDNVLFQLTAGKTDKQRAVNVTVIRKPVISRVETVKGDYGFLAYEVEDGRKLFFHMSDVIGEDPLRQGDDVEFVIVSQKDGKHSARQLRKIASVSGESPRPDRLISKLKTLELDKLKVTVLRQPRGPDGTRGFTHSRSFATATTAAPS